ncbi:kelch repeat and BTB domain-containing protein 8-like isoform X2 [Branchiostoma lanceolatum]|uniref:kelch repeat and BTB domain-containing protein 8-like isoform X2 n=1 Tax=Branchiostoma lanceolatum TaxID=7740 RepID=UPI0034566FE4
MAAADKEPHASAVRPRSYQDESYLHGFLETVGDLQNDGAFQDIILEVEGRRFPCHRLVLSAASPYFRAMFTSDMAESRQKTVVLQGLNSGMFGEILSYIYSGTLHVSLDKVQPLYQAADLLQLVYVRDTCSSYMVENVKVESSTCVDLYKFADVFSQAIVLKRCQQWIVRHFTEVASSEEFCSLSVNQLTEIISHDELDVKEETTVWEAVVRWVQHSREDRLHHLPSILPHIRFNLLTSDDTVAILEHPLVREDPGSSEVIKNVSQEPILKPRLGMTTEMAVLFNLYQGTNELLFMNPQKGKYISYSYDHGSLPRSEFMTVASDNNIYSLDKKVLKDEIQISLYKYDHAQNVWGYKSMFSVSKEPDYELVLEEHLCEIDQILYYMAFDLEADRPLHLLEMKKYNQPTNQWQECAQLEFDSSAYQTAALSCGSHIYFLTSEEVYRYDPREDRWCERTPPSPMMSIPDIRTAVAMRTEIFCSFIDTDGDSDSMVYNTESDCWQELQGWPNPGNFFIHDFPSLFVLENQLHIFIPRRDIVYSDGGPEEEYRYFVYVYDRSADVWRDLKAALPDKRYYAFDSYCPVARMYLPYLTNP